MFLRYLINPKPTIIIFFIVFCVVFSFIPLLKNDFSIVFYHNWASPYFIFSFGLILVFFHALGLNNLIYEKNIIKKDNLVLGVVYILLSTPFYNSINTWFISFFLLFFLNYLFESYQKESPLSQTFNATLILSILSFFYPNIILLFLLIIITGVNYGNINWRMLSCALLGAFLPYIFYFVYADFYNLIFTIPDFTIWEFMLIPDFKNCPTTKLIWIATLCLISFLSFMELFRWLYKKSIRSRKSFTIILFYFIVTLYISMLEDAYSAYYCLSPLSIVIANYFTYTKQRKIANILFMLLIFSSFAYRYLIVI